MEPLHPLPVAALFNQVGIDLLQLPLTTKGNCQVIVATDYLTKWVEARALPDKTASSVAGFLYEDIICRHGAPKELLSDQGTEFLNQLIEEICHLFEVTHRVTTPYHPQTNGLTERFNRTLVNTLSKLTQQHPDQEWDDLLPSALFAYRTLTHNTTRQTPFFLLHGYEATLPLEFTLPTYTIKTTNQEEYHKQLTRRSRHLTETLAQAQAKAQQTITTAQELYKQRYDQQKKISHQPRFKIGDQVLRARTELGNAKKNKLKPSFDGPFYIHQAHENGTYKLRRPDGRTFKKNIHGNHLKLYLPPPRPEPYIEILQWPTK